MSPYRILAATALVTLISVSGVALPYPILAPLFLDLAHPVSQFANLPPKLLLGAILAIYPLGILIGSNLIGAWSDRFGRRTILLWTMVGSALGYFLSAQAIAQGNFLLFALSRLVTGLFEGNLSVARAIASDLHPKIDRTKAFSWLSATTYGGYLIGPLLGGVLLPLGAPVAFTVAGIACAIAVGVIAVALPKDRPAACGQRAERHSLALLRDPRIRAFFTLYLLLMLSVNGFYEFYPVWLLEVRQFDSLDIAGATVLLTSTMIAVATLVNVRAKQRLGLARAGMVGMALFSLPLLLLPLSAGHYVLSFILMGAGIALYNAMLPSFLAERGGDYGQGALMGLMATTFFLGNVIMALLGSALALLDTRLVLTLSGLFGTVAMAQFGHLHFRRTTWPRPVSQAPAEKPAAGGL
ncbi:MFS transporter [Ferrimonas balearica]|uniref:MFS transporter n=1 Tax=Ferrimonas balearica TaxID=44012 RepID=UPI001C58F40C|nr:MFS transporter [Ferrimonas balearica]MBW3140239.1 MFS transporter [Ferrimonas balearica]MBY6106652.1 MFS transporter [Ferrimonas balearica]